MVLQEEKCYQNNIYCIAFLVTGIFLLLLLFDHSPVGIRSGLSLIAVDNAVSLVITMAVWHAKSLDQFKLTLLHLGVLTSHKTGDQTGVSKYLLFNDVATVD